MNILDVFRVEGLLLDSHEKLRIVTLFLVEVNSGNQLDVDVVVRVVSVNHSQIVHVQASLNPNPGPDIRPL